MDAAISEKAPRTDRGRRTLRKLLEAAAKEFGVRGYHEAAITGITQSAGVALGHSTLTSIRRRRCSVRSCGT
jgi:AcrR family transcriptional regulator